MKKSIPIMVSVLLLTAMMVSGCGSAPSTPPAATAPPATPDPADPAPALGEGEYPAFDNVKISVGTGTAGGAQFVYMGGVTKIVNENVPGLELIMEATSGSGGNLALMQSKEIGIGSIESAIASNAMNGIDLAEGQEAFTGIRSMFSSLPTHFGIWTLDPNITDIMQLAGKKVAVGPAAGSTDISSRNVFNFMGLVPGEIINLGWGDCFTALGERRLDAVTGSSLHPSPGVIELETKEKVYFVSFTPDQIKSLTDEFPYYKEVILDQSVYEGLEADYVTVGAWQAVYSSTDVDDDIVYAITKAVMENLDVLEATHSGGLTTRLENIDQQPVPLHNGAYRYYLEKGIDVPEELIPPEAK